MSYFISNWLRYRKYMKHSNFWNTFTLKHANGNATVLRPRCCHTLCSAISGPREQVFEVLERSKNDQNSKIETFNMTTNFWHHFSGHAYRIHISYITWKSWPNSWIFLIVYVESYVFVRVSMLFPGLPEATHLQWQLRWPLGGRRFSTAAQRNWRPGLSEDM